MDNGTCIVLHWPSAEPTHSFADNCLHVVSLCCHEEALSQMRACVVFGPSEIHGEDQTYDNLEIPSLVPQPPLASYFR